MEEGYTETLSKTFNRSGFKTGFLKLAILKMVSSGPAHGYALMKSIERVTDKDWKPSPGSIYPALQDLEKKGLISVSTMGRRRIYEITPKGRVVLSEAITHVKEVLGYLNKLFEGSEEWKS